MYAKTFAAVALTMAIASPAVAQQFTPLKGDPQALDFGFISTESSSNLKSQWQPLLTDMEKATGLKVNAFFASDYAGIIEGMRFGKVQVAWFGNKSAMEAVDRSNGEVFAKTINPDGTEGYYSHVIVPADSPIASIKDLLKCDKTVNFGIGDPNSTSGFLVPGFYVFAQNKVDPKGCFKTVRNANHETNLMAVANKQVDAATNNSEQMGRTEQKLPDVFKKVKIIWTSPLIASDPLVWRADLSAGMKQKISAFLFAYGQKGPNAEAEKKVLANIGSGLSAFKPSTNAQLVPIRQIELFKDRSKVDADEKLSAAEKQTRLAEIDAKLAKLAGEAKTN
jgi:phosphonate transport system substrate-binding protein